MPERLGRVLDRLRKTLSRRADQAYEDRDSAQDLRAEAYAEGEGHAYGVAEDDVLNEANESNER